MGKTCYSFFRLLCIITLLVPLLSAENLQAADDPRFFGTYCGEASYTFTYVVQIKMGDLVIGEETRRVDLTLQDIKVHLEYEQSSRGGLIHGRGSGLYEGGRIPFVITGTVTARGIARGNLKIRGADPYQGEARLSDDGLILRVNAHGFGSAVLRKDECGNDPPRVIIDNPDTERPFPYGDIIHFSARIIDEDPASSFPDRRLVWLARPAGGGLLGPSLIVGDGRDFHTALLPPGDHDITCTATDRGGLTGSDMVRVRVDNRSPNTPEILSPENGATLSDCQTILFRGQASDREDGFLPGYALTWHSSEDGDLGRGKRVMGRLSIGTHTITLTATDEAGSTTSTNITVHVTSSVGNCPPTPEIILPVSLYAVASGTELDLSGRVADREESTGWLTGDRMQWYAEWEGSGGRMHLGTGADLTIIVPEGFDTDTRVTIILEVTDNGGSGGEPPEVREDRVIIYVMPVPLI